MYSADNEQQFIIRRVITGGCTELNPEPVSSNEQPICFAEQPIEHDLDHNDNFFALDGHAGFERSADLQQPVFIQHRLDERTKLHQPVFLDLRFDERTNFDQPVFCQPKQQQPERERSVEPEQLRIDVEPQQQLAFYLDQPEQQQLAI
ncbi:MAG: hypothetical protein JOZ43_01950 [Acidobacteriales bacterium]|nr:hypothetical protein [Terriglobales bacterium]